jgi:hypothetical protein
MVLTAEQIKAAAKLIIESVDVPEWGGTVLVKMLSGKEKTAFYVAQSIARKANNDEPIENYQARFCVAVLCDEEGNRLYQDDQADELGDLPSSGVIIERIYDKARKLNCMFTEAEEEQLKNSAPIPSGAA